MLEPTTAPVITSVAKCRSAAMRKYPLVVASAIPATHINGASLCLRMDATVPPAAARANDSVVWPEKNDRLSLLDLCAARSIGLRAWMSGRPLANANLLNSLTLTAMIAASATTKNLWEIQPFCCRAMRSALQCQFQTRAQDRN